MMSHKRLPNDELAGPIYAEPIYTGAQHFLNEYARAYGRDPENNFAVASYEGNSASEIMDALRPGCSEDQYDIRVWGLARGEWRAALNAALAQHKDDDKS